jgi:hypothetical protein
MDPTTLTNLGAAGLIAAMWLLERRAAAAHTRALEQAHERLLAERRDTAILIRLVRDSTRALTAVERTQRAILAVVYFVAQIRDLPAPLGRRAWQLVGLLLVILICAGFLAAADKTALQLTYRNTCELLCKAQVAGHIVPRECHGGPPSRLLWLASVPTLAGMIAAVFAAAVASTAAGVFPKSSEEEWRAAFAERVRTVQRAFYLTSAVLVTSTVSIKLFLELPGALSADEATTVAIDSFANGMTGFWGTVFSLTLVMIFAPSGYFMLTAAQRHERASETPSEVRAWLSEHVTASFPKQVGNLAAGMAPLLVGPVGTLLQKLVEVG